MKFIKKILYLEPLIIVIRFLGTLTLKSIIFTFIVPLLICIGLLIRVVCGLSLNISFDIISVCAILIGFCASILIMLFTIGGKVSSTLKATQLSNKKHLYSTHWFIDSRL